MTALNYHVHVLENLVLAHDLSINCQFYNQRQKFPQNSFHIFYDFFRLGRLMLAEHLNAASPIAHGTMTTLASFSHFMRIWYHLP